MTQAKKKKRPATTAIQRQREKRIPESVTSKVSWQKQRAFDKHAVPCLRGKKPLSDAVHALRAEYKQADKLITAWVGAEITGG